MKTTTKLLTGATILTGAIATKKYFDNKKEIKKPIEITN